MQWLMFQYSVPNKPSRLRVYVWRKLKALRAEPLLEGLYVLPLTAKTAEQFEWLCAEVTDMGGEAVLWKSEILSSMQETVLIARFQEEAHKGYQKVQEMLLEKPEDNQKAWLENIMRLYANIRYHDYFDTQQHYTIHTQIENHYRRLNK